MIPTIEEYKIIYQLLDPGPLEEDCGLLCNAACCQSYDYDIGIYLLPGEEKLFTEEDKSWLTWEIHNPKHYEFPHSWTQPVYYAKCIKQCPRHKRPIQCRTFPLTPHITKQDELIFIWETLDLPYLCPLIDNKYHLNDSYVMGLKQAWKMLIKSSLIRDLIKFDSKQRKKDKVKIIPYNI